MKAMISSSIGVAALAALALPISLSAANAMPAAQAIPLAQSTPDVILTSGGCGPFRHRGFYGYCRPNFVGYGYGWRRPWGWGPGWHRWGWRHW